jgi:branched-chain amino acid transport system permease protein
MPLWIAFPLTIAIAFAGAVALERVVVRPVERAAPLTVVILCLGLLITFNGLAGWIWGYTVRTFPSPFPTTPLHIGSAAFSSQDLGIIAVSLLSLGAISLFFGKTKLGLAMRAAALYPESSRVLGVRVGWMLALGWGMAAAVGALSGLMVAPVVLLEPNMMQGILVYAFAAAVLGGIDSPVGAVVGGLALGVGLNLIGAYVPVIGTDLQLTTAFGIIIVILLFRPAGLFGRRTMRRV